VDAGRPHPPGKWSEGCACAAVWLWLHLMAWAINLDVDVDAMGWLGIGLDGDEEAFLAGWLLWLAFEARWVQQAG